MGDVVTRGQLLVCFRLVIYTNETEYKKINRNKMGIYKIGVVLYSYKRSTSSVNSSTRMKPCITCALRRLYLPSGVFFLNGTFKWSYRGKGIFQYEFLCIGRDYGFDLNI